MTTDINNSTSEQPLAEDNGDKNLKRSRSYPSKLHNYVVSFVERIYTELGSSDYHGNEDIAKAHNLAIPSIKPTLSTAQQYGLLELKHGVGYKVTPLAIKIFHPENDSEKIASIIESLKSSDLFNDLINQFNGQVVPSLNGVTNILIRRFDFKSIIAEKVAEIFIDNLKQYNLINPKNVLVVENKKDNGVVNNKTQESLNNQTIDSNSTKLDEKKFAIEPGIVDIVIPLKSSNQKAHLLIPENYKEEDLDRIAKFVDALK